MQGKKELQTELFSTVNIENFIPKNHLLRRIDHILDLRFIHKLTQALYCDQNGRPSIDPEVFFRMCLVGYLYGISSDRQLCEELQFNLAYRWFCKFSLNDSIPDHSSMTRIRDRLGVKVLEEIFNKILDLCLKKKMIKRGGEILFDSSHIPANAALNSLVRNDATKAEIKDRPNCIRGETYRNETHTSCTDPDATMSGKTGVPKGLYYKVHQAVDRKSRIILDPHVTTGNVHDSKALMERIDFLEENRNYKVSGVVADRAYGSGESLEELKSRKIETHIGTFRKDACQNVKNLPYNKKKDCFYCPEGHKLHGNVTANTAKRYSFKAWTKPCSACPLRSTCELRSVLKRENYLMVNTHHRAILRAGKKEKTKKFRKKLRERMWKIEGLFGEAKQNHCLDRAKYRGLQKVQIQAYMIASVQNLKRLVSQEFSYLCDLLACGLKNRKFIFFPSQLKK